MSRIFRSIHQTSSLPKLRHTDVSARVADGIAFDEGLDRHTWWVELSAYIQGSNKRDKPYLVHIVSKYRSTKPKKLNPRTRASKKRQDCLVLPYGEMNTNGPLEVLAEFPTSKTKFRVSCSCQDYKFTYARPNFENGYHYGGEPEAIESKGTGSPRNPEHKTGSCKHILALHETLVHMKYIR